MGSFCMKHAGKNFRENSLHCFFPVFFMGLHKEAIFCRIQEFKG
jgi:hypothetical protein